MDAKIYPPVGRCIYCPATRYAEGCDRTLATEHIIPLSLGGELELLESSCKACEAVTGRIDSKATNNHLIGPRLHFGLKGRTPDSKRAKQQRLYVQDPPGPDRVVLVDVEDYPSALYLPTFLDPPALLLLADYSAGGDPSGMWFKVFNNNPEMLKEKYGIDGSYAPPAMFLPWFCRMVAKMAHSFAVAELGLNGFTPCLEEILSDPDMGAMDIMPFIGGRPMEENEDTDELHTIKIERGLVADTKVVMVFVRLFAKHGGPTYVVVVGTESGERQPPLPSDPVVADILRRLGTPSAPSA